MKKPVEEPGWLKRLDEEHKGRYRTLNESTTHALEQIGFDPNNRRHKAAEAQIRLFIRQHLTASQMIRDKGRGGELSYQKDSWWEHVQTSLINFMNADEKTQERFADAFRKRQAELESKP